MKNEMKKNRKVWLIIPFAVILVLAGAVILYIGANVLNVKESKEDGQLVAVVPTEALEKEVLEVVQSEESDKQVYVMEVEEVINSKPVNGDTAAEVEDEKVSEAAVVDMEEKASNQDVTVDKPKSDGKKEKTDKAAVDSKKKSDSKNSSKGKKKDDVEVVDESPKTVKDEKVNEYKGGEKKGNGNSFFDNMPEQKPSGDLGEEHNKTVDPSGVEVGTWG